jgi:putative redox protein
MLTARIDQEGVATSRATVRQHTSYVDRPIPKGGADKGPAGGEYLLVGLGGCFTSHLLAAIAARNAGIAGVSVSVTGVLDRAPERFARFELAVSATSGDRDTLAHLVTLAERTCQVTTTLRLAAPVTVRVEGASS